MEQPETRLDHFDFGRFGQVDFLTWVHSHTQYYGLGKPEEYAKYIHPGSFAVDIGAYTGDTTVPMALCTGPIGKVVAFEPGPVAFDILTKNVELTKLPIDAYSNAVTSTPGEFTFHYVEDHMINGGFSTEIECGPEACHNKVPYKVTGVNLAFFLMERYSQWLPKWSFLKIDTEGYDKEILKSCAALIMQYRPVIRVEAYPFLTINERQELIDAIKHMNYKYLCPESHFFHQMPHVFNVICVPDD